MDADVVVIGAGMAGLTAARSLRAAGLTPLVLDKGRAVGGRMATRRIDGAAFDHGAQHISVRTGPFRDEMERLVDRGTARVWLRTQSVTRPERGVEERYVGIGGMRRIPEALAEGLPVTTETRVEHLGFENQGVTAHADDGRVWTAAAAIVTPPLPQSLELLHHSGLGPGGGVESIAYDATLAVMAALDRPSGLADGHAAFSDGPLAWMADNQHKGTSGRPALTIHSSAGFAAAHLETDAETWAAMLLEAARPHHEGRVTDVRPHRWRYSQPQDTREDRAVRIDAPAPVVLAGEVFAGARVEGAFTSGRRAAEVIAAALR